MSGRIFVSSTCYDLLDLRSEVEAHLKDLGLTPIMSDRASSDFVVDPRVDSIETCLVNVRDADEFICIVCHRYGGPLGASGFEDLSATHLEYREAKKAGKPIRFYVRDKTEADFGTWKRMKGDAALKLAWVKDPRQHGLFDLLEEHRTLQAGAPSTNWYWTFRDSVDLKQRLTTDLGRTSRTATLRRLLERGSLPHVQLTTASRTGGGRRDEPSNMDIDVVFEMFGPQSIFNCRLSSNGVDIKRPGNLGPGTKLRGMKIKGRTEPDQQFLEWTVCATYETESGHTLRDTFLVRHDSWAESHSEVVQHVSKELVGGASFAIL